MRATSIRFIGYLSKQGFSATQTVSLEAVLRYQLMNERQVLWHLRLYLKLSLLWCLNRITITTLQIERTNPLECYPIHSFSHEATESRTHFPRHSAASKFSHYSSVFLDYTHRCQCSTFKPLKSRIVILAENYFYLLVSSFSAFDVNLDSHLLTKRKIHCLYNSVMILRLKPRCCYWFHFEDQLQWVYIHISEIPRSLNAFLGSFSHDSQSSYYDHFAERSACLCKQCGNPWRQHKSGSQELLQMKVHQFVAFIRSLGANLLPLFSLG